MDKFDITYFYGPPGYGHYPVDEEVIRAIADCGFTSIPMYTDRADLKRLLKLMDKYGLTCNAVFETRITDRIIVAENRDSFTQEEIDEEIRSLTEDLGEYGNITGWNVIDEPSADFFPVMQKVIAAFRKYSPGKELHINIWPNYANSEQLRAENYEAYLKQYLEEIDPDYLSFDYYHFTSEKSTSDLARLFDNLELIRSAGLRCGKDYMQIVLLTRHMHYADLTPYQLRWEVNTALAYGAKRISYFTFWNDPNMERDGWENACMTSKAEKTEHYYEVQKINKWLLPLGRELFGKKSTAVFHLGDDSPGQIGRYARGYTPFGALGECAGSGFLLGFFDDGSFMIVNKQYYEETPGAKNRFTFPGVRNGIEYFSPETASWRDAGKDGIVTADVDGCHAEFGPGEGILFRKV